MKMCWPTLMLWARVRRRDVERDALGVGRYALGVVRDALGVGRDAFLLKCQKKKLAWTDLDRVVFEKISKRQCSNQKIGVDWSRK